MPMMGISQPLLSFTVFVSKLNAFVISSVLFLSVFSCPFSVSGSVSIAGAAVQLPVRKHISVSAVNNDFIITYP